MGIGSDLAEEAAPSGSIEIWLRKHPEEAAEFWDYVKGTVSNGYPLYPVMGKLVAKLGGPPGSESSIRRYISGKLAKLQG